MARITILGIVVLLMGFVGGFVTHLHYYPKEAFSNFYQKMAEENREGHWIHRRHLIDHTSSDFPRPNNDTLYSYCVVDLAKGPVVIEVPSIDRYWSVQFLRDNTDTFHYLASRTHGLNKSIKALLVSQGYSGKNYGLEVVYAPTKRVWLFARLLIDGPADIPHVIHLQNQLKCTPLNQYKPI